jgi:hypothetical protein
MARSPCKHPDASITLPHILEGVQSMPTLLGCIERLRYLDHDVADAGKFPEFSQQVYMKNIGTSPFGDPMMQPKQWEIGLVNTRILKLVEIPHFGRGKEVNNYVKQLMAVLHGGFLWMEEPISINVELITFIIGLLSMGESLTQYLDENINGKALDEEIKKTYNKKRGWCEIIIKRIIDTTTRIATKLMSCKLLRKCCKEEVPTRVVTYAFQCANETILSWPPYMLNMFLDKCKDAQN